MAKRNVKVAELDLLVNGGDTIDVTQQQADDAQRAAAADKLEALIEAERIADGVRGAELACETADERFVRRINEAQERLGELRLRPMVRQLLDASCDNVGSANGAGITDPDARATIQNRAALFTACKGDLTEVIEMLVDNLDVASAPGQVYATCFAVQKAANFVANLQYRRALATEEDRRAEAVTRGEAVAQSFDAAHVDPPVGLGGGEEDELRFGNEVEHRDTSLRPDQELLAAYEELHLYLQLVAEAHGWDADAPMPFLFTQNKDGTFNAVYDAEHALDIMEVRSKESRARREKTRAAGLAAALAGAKKKMLAAVKKAA